MLVLIEDHLQLIVTNGFNIIAVQVLLIYGTNHIDTISIDFLFQILVSLRAFKFSFLLLGRDVH